MALNTIDIIRSQDIHISDLALQKEYIETFQSGAINTAQQIITNNQQLHSKVITPDLVNSIGNGILKLEYFFNDDVTAYLANLLNQFQAKIDDIVFLGEYVSTQDYNIGNFVLYNGDIYMCIKNGVSPITDTTAWLFLGLKGDVGDIGSGVTYRGKWDSLIEYAPKDMVTYDNNLYVSITTNMGQTPSARPADWFMAIEVKERGILTGPTEPPDIISGDLWWQYI